MGKVGKHVTARFRRPAAKMTKMTKMGKVGTRNG